MPKPVKNMEPANRIDPITLQRSGGKLSFEIAVRPFIGGTQRHFYRRLPCEAEPGAILDYGRRPSDTAATNSAI